MTPNTEPAGGRDAGPRPPGAGGPAGLAAGVDCRTTHTFGANLGNLGEYGMADRIFEPAEAGADHAAGRIGVPLPEEFQLAPGQSTDALIAHHPEAKYFST